MLSQIYHWIETWRKTIWWALLVGLFLFYVWNNSNRILSQNLIPIDYIIVILLLLLLLLPLASEIDFLGFSIKKEIESLKTEIREQNINLRNEIQTTANIQNIINFPQPLSDEKLKKQEHVYKKVLGLPLTYEVINPDYEKSKEIDPLDSLDISKNVKNLSNARIILDNELTRIYEERFGGRKKPPRIIPFLTRYLIDEGLIDDRLAGLINEIRIICDNAAHGGVVTNEQYEFVKKFFPKLILTLKEI